MQETKSSSPGAVANSKSFSRKCIEWSANLLHTPTSAAAVSSGHEPSADGIKLICISDTHCTKPILPEGDVILHSGDLSIRGTYEEVQAQLDWLNTQPHLFKIIIGGNHDYVLDDEAYEKFKSRPKDPPLAGRRRVDLRFGDVIYLDRTATEISVRGRKIKIWGSPMTPQFGRWAFQYPPTVDIWSQNIPTDTDVVLTHGPPRAHMDPGRHGVLAGCPFLLQEIRRVQPKVHIFGHVHEGRGRQIITGSAADVAYDKIVGEDEGWIGLSRLVQAKIMGESSAAKDIHLVNAAVVQTAPYDDVSPPIVVTI